MATKDNPPQFIDVMDVLVNILECFGQYEGTWYQSHWKEFGVTPMQEAIVEAAWKKKYGDTR